jgi:pSer/pThr/pTyr-binding forkhead associated (FHA) protein
MRFRLSYGRHEFDLPVGTTHLGRSLDCQVTLDDPAVSRRHAALIVDDAGARIANLASRNGVTVDGVAVSEPMALSHGVTIGIGNERLIFLVVSDPSVGARAFPV